MHLIIKGNREQAARAASERGIEFVPLRELAQWNETTGIAPKSREAKIRAWMAEEPTSAPFPTGALLLFSEHF